MLCRDRFVAGQRVARSGVGFVGGGATGRGSRRGAFAAARWHGAKSIGIAGGVSANSRLRSEALAKAERSEIPVYIPRLSLSTDNAAMIAAAGLRQLAAGKFAPPDLNAAASLPL